MGSVLGLWEDKIEVDSARYTYCGKGEEAVGLQAFLWKVEKKTASYQSAGKQDGCKLLCS